MEIDNELKKKEQIVHRGANYTVILLRIIAARLFVDQNRIHLYKTHEKHRS